MKIEIGESLIYSWLRHSHNCQVCQLNWKTSEKWNIDESDLTYCQNLMDELSLLFNNPFKQTKDINQLLKQCEIDALGIDTFNSNLFAIDIAFHSGGLGYHNPLENVTKKILRTVFAIIVYFKNIQNYNIFFVSPKISKTLNQNIQYRIDEINKFLSNNNIKINIDLYSNEKFSNNILKPILSASNDISDTSELFLRSYQLIKLSEKYITQSAENLQQKYSVETSSDNKDIKIGKLVQIEFKNLIENEKLSITMINNLQNSEYSNRIFNMTYPILKKIVNTLNINEERKINGYDRYYAKPIESYLLCNNWYEHHRLFFIQWLSNFH
ncbi:MAG: hypothetical protein KAQ94_02385 [Arcobacteraceae bacterium]|nr:hypothetical protein [Arcobacteraceae bacterium]